MGYVSRTTTNLQYTLQSASHEQRSDQQEAEAEEMPSSIFNKSFVSMLYR